MEESGGSLRIVVEVSSVAGEAYFFAFRVLPNRRALIVIGGRASSVSDTIGRDRAYECDIIII